MAKHNYAGTLDENSTVSAVKKIFEKAEQRLINLYKLNYTVDLFKPLQQAGIKSADIHKPIGTVELSQSQGNTSIPVEEVLDIISIYINNNKQIIFMALKDTDYSLTTSDLATVTAENFIEFKNPTFETNQIIFLPILNGLKIDIPSWNQISLSKRVIKESGKIRFGIDNASTGERLITLLRASGFDNVKFYDHSNLDTLSADLATDLQS